MKILVVHGRQIKSYPPVRSLILNLLANNHSVVLLTRGLREASIPQHKNLKCIEIPFPDYTKSRLLRPLMYIQKKRVLRQIAVEEMKDCDLIWTTTDTTVRDLGDVLFNYKHIMQLMELIEDIPAVPDQKLFGLNIKRYAKKAYKVVVPEFHRAYIQKVWWKLDRLPCVLPNKPYDMPALDELDDDVKEEINRLKRYEKTVVLYQGGFERDRNLQIIAKAVRKAQDEFVFCIMGKDNESRRLLCAEYPFIHYIPFIKPPYHMAVTSAADIGVLPYFPRVTAHLSELNAVFCAPNKTFEYAAYGLPMLGTNVPGLVDVFEKYDIGLNYDENETDEAIIQKLRSLRDRHKEISENCLTYYNSVNLDEIVKDILS